MNPEAKPSRPVHAVLIGPLLAGFVYVRVSRADGTRSHSHRTATEAWLGGGGGCFGSINIASLDLATNNGIGLVFNALDAKIYPRVHLSTSSRPTEGWEQISIVAEKCSDASHACFE